MGGSTESDARRIEIRGETALAGEALGDDGVESRISTDPLSRTSGGDQLYFNDPDGTSVQLSANGFHG